MQLHIGVAPGTMQQEGSAGQRQAELVPARKARLEAEFGVCPVRGRVYDPVLRIEHLGAVAVHYEACAVRMS